MPRRRQFQYDILLSVPARGHQKALQDLVNSGYPLIIAETHEEERLEGVLAAVAQDLTVPLFTWTTTDGFRRHGRSETLYKTEPPEAALMHIEASGTAGIYLLKDFQVYFDRHHIVRKLRDLCAGYRDVKRSIVLCGTRIDVPADLDREAARFELALPGDEELRTAVVRALKQMGEAVRLQLSREQFDRLVSQMHGLTLREADRLVFQLTLDGVLSAEDLLQVIDRKKELVRRGGILEFILVKETADSVGGLANLKRWLTQRRKAFSPEARAMNLPVPKGVLLLGVQGCGKSLCAKAIAGEFGFPLLRLDPGALYDKFIGESEKNMMRAIRSAEAMAPCVLWIDELEKGMAQGDARAADGGLSQRLLGTFLSWMQERTESVFVVATSNNIEALPPELLRKGRFDEIFFVDLPDEATRARIFEIHIRRRDRDPKTIDCAALAKEADGFSGAEIEHAVVSCLYETLDGTPLATEALRKEIRRTRPLSVVMSEKVDALREWAKGRTVTA